MGASRRGAGPDPAAHGCRTKRAARPAWNSSTAMPRRSRQKSSLKKAGFAGGDQRSDCLVDEAVGVERRFQEILVETDAEGREVGILLVTHCRHGKAPYRIQIVAGAIAGIFRKIGARNFAHVFALVPVLGKRRACARRFAHPRLHRKREIRDLRAGIVVIVFAMDAVTLRLHQARDRITDRRRASMAHMQGASRVRGDEFDDGPRSLRRRDRSERVGLVENPRYDGTTRRVRKKHIDESRARHFNPLHRGRRLEHRDQRLRQLTRISLESFGQLQGDVARIIAVLRLFRALERNRRRDVFRSNARKAGGQPFCEL